MSIGYLLFSSLWLSQIALASNFGTPNTGYANYSASYAVDESGYGANSGLDTGQGYFTVTPFPTPPPPSPAPPTVTPSPFGRQTTAPPVSGLAAVAASVLHDQGYLANLTNQDTASLMGPAVSGVSGLAAFDDQARKYSSTNPGSTVAQGPMTAGLQYVPTNGYSWVDWAAPSAAPVFVGVAPKQSAAAATAALNNLIADPRFATCDQDPSDGACVAVMNETELMMVSILNSIDFTMPNAFSQIINWFTQLGLSSSQLDVLNYVINGDPAQNKLKGGPLGFAKKLSTLAMAIPQLATVISKAYETVLNTDNQRNGIYDSEFVRLTARQKDGAATLQDMTSRMSIVNQQKALYQIQQSLGGFGAGLGQVGSDAADLASDLQSGLDDANSQYSDWSDDYLGGQMPQLVQQASPLSQAARDTAHNINATYRSAAKLMILTAQNQQQDRSSDVTKMFADSAVGLNNNLAKLITAQNRSDIDMLFDASQTLDNTNQKSGPLIAQLNTSANGLLPQGITALNTTLATLIGEANALVANANFKSVYLGGIMDDVGRLSSDAAGSVGSTAQYSSDLLAQLKAAFAQNVSVTSGSSKNMFDSLIGGVANSIVSTQSEVDSLSNKTTQTASDLQDSSINSLAGISGDAAGNAGDSVDALSTANAALMTLASVGAAKTKLATDSAATALAQSSGTIQNALESGATGVEELSQASAEDIALANRQITGMIQSSPPPAAASLTDLFAGFVASTSRSAATAKAGNLDAKSGLTALSVAQNATQTSADSYGHELSDLAAAQNANYNALTAQANGTSLMASTADAATAAATGSASSGIAAYSNYLTSLIANGQATVTQGIGTVSDVLKARIEQFQSPRAAHYSDGINAIEAQLNSAGQVGSWAHLEPYLTMLVSNETAYLMGQIAAQQAAGNNNTDELDSAVTQIQAVLTRLMNSTETELQARLAAIDSVLANAKNLRRNVGQVSAMDLAMFSNLQDESNSLTFSAPVMDVHANWASAMSRLRQSLVNESAWVSSQLAGGQFGDVSERVATATAELRDGTGALRATVSQANSAFDAVTLAERKNSESMQNRFLTLMTSMGVSANDARSQLDAIRVAGDLKLSRQQGLVNAKLAEVINRLGQLGPDSPLQQLSAAASSVAATIGQVNASTSNAIQTANYTDMLNSIQAGRTLLGSVPELGSSEQVLLNAQNRLKSSQSPWSKYRAQSYTLQGQLSQLSGASQQELVNILKQFESGSINLDDAVAKARIGGPINSEDDALVALAGAADAYRDMVDSAFAGANDRLVNTTTYVNIVLAAMANDLMEEVTNLNSSGDTLSARASNFSTNVTQTINNDTSVIDTLKAAIEANQASVGAIMSNLQTSIDSFEGSLKSNETDYESWVDATIANETNFASSKATALRATLQGAANTSSLVQTNGLHAMHLDLHEGRTRKTYKRGNRYQ